ncbi:MAG: M17 family peptidase N-terminal domain-containing protein, partial [Gemmatimonadales bacterium]
MPFESTVSTAAPAAFATPLLAVAVPQGTALPPSLASLDAAAGGALARLYAAGDFGGKRDEVGVLYPSGPANRVVLVGLGKVESTASPDVRRAAAIATKRARTLGAPSGAFHLAPEGRGALGWREVGQRTAEGLAQGAWVYNDMKKPPEDHKPPLEAFTLLAPEGGDELRAGHQVGAAIGAGQTFTRGLQVLPGNVCTPSHLGRTAEELARRHGFEVTVLDRAAIQRE